MGSSQRMCNSNSREEVVHSDRQSKHQIKATAIKLAPLVGIIRLTTKVAIRRLDKSSKVSNKSSQLSQLEGSGRVSLAAVEAD